MDVLIKNKKEYKKEISEYQKKILELENKIITIEKEMANFSDMEILDTLKLSEQQRAIVESKDKNMLVVACPGSGKTHTLISRYINLVVKERVDPDNIIMITFTKKAGMEMNDRINNIIPNRLPHYVGSLHGLGYRLLQQNTKISNTVMDEKDSCKILRDCMNKLLENEDLTSDEKSLLVKQIAYVYDKVSTSYPLIIDETIEKLNINIKYKKYITKCLREYNKEKKKQNLYDYNDLMIKFCELFDNNKLDNFVNKIQYIFFDEYQDSNNIMNYILSKFKSKSNIMVVGDDAQAIYAFRGSSVEHIWKFEENFPNTKTYYLETNYRSTPMIVKFCQDIISHNTKQFKKNVVSSLSEPGLKPYVFCQNSQIDQYKWVADDIMKKNKNGIPLSDMVVLARTNRSLDDLEGYLLKYKIPIIKSIGVSLLNKIHIKDFFAFLTIVVNPKSLFHWKRVLALHKNIGIEKANYVLEYNNNNVLKGLKELVENETFYKNNLSSLVEMLENVNNTIVISKKISYIESYIQYLYASVNKQKIDEKMEDIKNILTYFGDCSIEDFINNIYLNCEMETEIGESLFLCTAHSAKGLEWKYVYILDMTSKDFPCIRQDFYKYEADNCEEERRLFYVAASRAKQYIMITYYENTDSTYSVVESPFIKELNHLNYLSHNIKQKKDTFTGFISKDVMTHLRFKGYSKLSQHINKLHHERENIVSNKYFLPIPNNLKNMYIIGNFMDYLIVKMIHNHFHNKCYKFDLPLNNIYPNFPKQLYHNYKDYLIDWRDMLDEIMMISTWTITSKSIVEEYTDILLNSDMIAYYKVLEKAIIKTISLLKPNKIMTHFNLNYNNFRAEADIIIDDTLIEMKCSTGEACTFANLTQTLMYGYLLSKKQIKINKVVIMNSYNGTTDTLDVSELNFDTIKKILYV